MKKLLMGLMLCMSTTAFSQVLDYSNVESTLRLDFNQGAVCKVDPSFGLPVLGYGDTKLNARANAINNCIAAGNSGMFCDDVECESISLGESGATLSIVANGAGAGVLFSIDTPVTCYVEASFNQGIFYAQAPTVLEAEVHATRLCVDITKLNKMHCKLDRCEQAAINIGDIGDLFGGGRALEQKIEALEAEIADLEREYEAETNSRARKKLLKKIQRKQNKLADLKAQQ